jgi:hypothetical protein
MKILSGERMLSDDSLLAMVGFSRIGDAVDEAFCARPTPAGGHSEEDCMSDALIFAEIGSQHVELLRHVPSCPGSAWAATQRNA